MAKQKSIHYVDNKKFLQAMIEWHADCDKKGEQVPVTNYIGECFLKIATHLLRLHQTYSKRKKTRTC